MLCTRNLGNLAELGFLCMSTFCRSSLSTCCTQVTQMPRSKARNIRIIEQCSAIMHCGRCFRVATGRYRVVRCRPASQLLQSWAELLRRSAAAARRLRRRSCCWVVRPSVLPPQDHWAGFFMPLSTAAGVLSSMAAAGPATGSGSSSRPSGQKALVAMRQLLTICCRAGPDCCRVGAAPAMGE